MNPFYWQERMDDALWEAYDHGFDSVEEYYDYLESLKDEIADREVDERLLKD